MNPRPNDNTNNYSASPYAALRDPRFAELDREIEKMPPESAIQKTRPKTRGYDKSWPEVPELGSDEDYPLGIVPLRLTLIRELCRAMAVTKGDYEHASELLGISRTTLFRWLKQYRNSGKSPSKLAVGVQ